MTAGRPRLSWRAAAAKGRRLVVFGVLLGAFSIIVPDATRPPAEVALIKLEKAHGLDAHDNVIWFLALGSDARPGQPVVRSRSDAIQLVGVNVKTHHAVTIGIPRDSYVSIPGSGNNKINAAMVFGGPELTARAVQGLTGIRANYVFITSFRGVKRMVNGIKGVKVKVSYPMNDLNQRFRPGLRTLNGTEALAFARIRHGLPRGDFDRSMDQGQLLKGGLKTIAGKQGRIGFVERALGYFARFTDTNIGPAELYRLSRAVLEVNPALVRICVLRGGTGTAGGASVVFPDVAAARGLGQDVRRDAIVDRGC